MLEANEKNPSNLTGQKITISNKADCVKGTKTSTGCTSGKYKTCLSTGKWGTCQSCASGKVWDATKKDCVTKVDECTPNDKTGCADGKYKICNSSGQWGTCQSCGDTKTWDQDKKECVTIKNMPLVSDSGKTCYTYDSSYMTKNMISSFWFCGKMKKDYQCGSFSARISGDVKDEIISLSSGKNFSIYGDTYTCCGGTTGLGAKTGTFVKNAKTTRNPNTRVDLPDKNGYCYYTQVLDECGKETSTPCSTVTQCYDGYNDTLKSGTCVKNKETSIATNSCTPGDKKTCGANGTYMKCDRNKEWTTQCTKCDNYDNVATWHETIVCEILTCKDGYMLYDKRCVAAAPIETCKASGGQYTYDQCVCTNTQNKVQNSSKTACVCATGWAATGAVCDKCAHGYTMNGNKCEKLNCPLGQIVGGSTGNQCVNVELTNDADKTCYTAKSSQVASVAAPFWFCGTAKTKCGSVSLSSKKGDQSFSVTDGSTFTHGKNTYTCCGTKFVINNGNKSSKSTTITLKNGTCTYTKTTNVCGVETSTPCTTPDTCNTGFTLVDGKCVDTEKYNACTETVGTWNSTTEQCDCKSGWTLSTQGTCTETDEHKGCAPSGGTWGGDKCTCPENVSKWNSAKNKCECNAGWTFDEKTLKCNANDAQRACTASGSGGKWSGGKCDCSELSNKELDTASGSCVCKTGYSSTDNCASCAYGYMASGGTCIKIGCGENAKLNDAGNGCTCVDTTFSDSDGDGNCVKTCGENAQLVSGSTTECECKENYTGDALAGCTITTEYSTCTSTGGTYSGGQCICSASLNMILDGTSACKCMSGYEDADNNPSTACTITVARETCENTDGTWTDDGCTCPDYGLEPDDVNGGCLCPNGYSRSAIGTTCQQSSAYKQCSDTGGDYAKGNCTCNKTGTIKDDDKCVCQVGYMPINDDIKNGCKVNPVYTNCIATGGSWSGGECSCSMTNTKSIDDGCVCTDATYQPINGNIINGCELIDTANPDTTDDNQSVYSKSAFQVCWACAGRPDLFRQCIQSNPTDSANTNSYCISRL